MRDPTLKRHPHPALRKRSNPLSKITSVELDIIDEMVNIMYKNEGVGLAAPQVGISKQIAVVDDGTGLLKLVNPIIVSSEGEEAMEEGCLSVPNVVVRIKRPKKVVVEFLNESGEHLRLETDGLLARAIQHEIDHLNGRLIIDYQNPVKKFF